ncbi:MAG TPA: sugar ABC transporter permease [Blastocatellia bacterium]|jgi:D-xylose transport system permease protein|nr:sugar ABC transporter permease [Blastocatellia bacterium]
MTEPVTEPVAQQPEAEAPRRPWSGFKASSAWRTYTMVFALIAIWLIFAYTTGGVFLEARNFSNLMRQATITGVLAVGMLMVIVTGHIDLSIGSAVGLAGGVAAIADAWLGWGLAPSLAIGIAVGLAIGAVQGALVAYGNIPAFIVTLGGLLAWRGAIKGISKGNTIPIGLPAFKAIGQGYLTREIGIAIMILMVVAISLFAVRRNRLRQRHGQAAINPLRLAAQIVIPSGITIAFILALNGYAGVPIPVIILLAVALVGMFLTQNTTFGRYLYAIGGNPDAARLSGINLRHHTIGVFCIMGALAGVAGIIYTARVGSASPDAGRLLELDAIAACVIGGTSLMGGRGTVFGALLGALFMASLDNGMSLRNYEDFTQDIVKGVILVAAVGLDMFGRKRG